jgi:pimeloyl-ACP methyl ester carboxylesterase
MYDMYYPSDYAQLGFLSPIITWGNGTDATPGDYTTLLDHLASWGFTVIATVLANTGSGNEITAAAEYLVIQDSTPGSPFDGDLDINEIAAVGHSQGAGGATRAAINNPTLIKTLVTFSLPSSSFVFSNSDCPTAGDCMYNPAQLTQPVFFIGTHGLVDLLIASPSTEAGYFDEVPGPAALGLIDISDGVWADHASIENASDGGQPGGFLGYTTAWLMYQLRGDTTAEGAFFDPTAPPELLANSHWPASAVKSG